MAAGLQRKTFYFFLCRSVPSFNIILIIWDKYSIQYKRERLEDIKYLVWLDSLWCWYLIRQTNCWELEEVQGELLFYFNITEPWTEPMYLSSIWSQQYLLWIWQWSYIGWQNLNPLSHPKCNTSATSKAKWWEFELCDTSVMVKIVASLISW